MRICITAPYDLAEEGGVKRHALNLAAALRQLGDEVDVVGPTTRDGSLGDGVHGFGGVINIPTNGSHNNIALFASPLQLWQLLRRKRYDVLHLHEPMVPALNYWLAWGAGNAARVCTFHGFTEVEDPTVRLGRKILSSVVLPFCDRAIAVSIAAERFAHIVWPGPIAMIPNGVPTSTFVPPEDREKNEAPRALRLLFVGNYRDPRKGLPILLEAFRRLRAEGRRITLDVVGQGPLNDEPGVAYLGPISDEKTLAAHYAACDLFVSPATGQESFGIVLLEAMAAARPIVCSDIEGYHCAVGYPPEAGAVFFPPGSVDALAASIADLDGDPARRRAFGDANRRRSLSFDWATLALRVRSEYLAAIEARHGAAAARRHERLDALVPTPVAVATPAAL